jgi:ribosomal protein S12 methylthiotransferase
MGDSAAICFITLGCPKNEVDSDRMAALVEASAYRLVDTPEAADVVVLNTCSFIQDATEESIAAAFELANDWRPAREGRRFVVAGCMPSRYGEELVSALPEADAFVPVADEHSILEVIERLTGVPARPSAPHPRTTPSATAYLKVSEGCDRRCAYCTIPAIRGPFISAPADALLAEARLLIAGGARELVLVGQDIASWGRDLTPAADLASIVRDIAELPGDFRVRLMYLQPDGVTDGLLATIAAHPRVCHYLDLPLQHASRDVLRAMGRTGDRASHLALVTRIRSALPDVVLRTTVMAGFPGETEDHSAELESFLEEASFDYAGVFAYSPEEGTRAATAEGQVRRSVRVHRAQRLRDAADRIGFARAASRVGSIAQVLVEGPDETGETVGRTCGQAPDVDGLTIIEGDAAPGTFIDVRITDAVGYDLVGVPL